MRSGLRLFHFVLLLVVASLVFLHAVENVVLQNAQDQEEPEEIHRLQAGKQRESDVLTDPAFVLLCFPVQLERPDSPELGQNGPEDFQVDDVPKVDPCDNERAEVGHGEDGIEVVQCLRSLPNRQYSLREGLVHHTARKKSETSWVM